MCVVGEDGPRYHVYFPEDSEIRKDVPEKAIRPPSAKGFWSKTRIEFIGKSFTNPEGGDEHAACEYIIKDVGTGEVMNKYVCEKKHEDDAEKNEEHVKQYLFDVGHVLRIIKDQTERKSYGQP